MKKQKNDSKNPPLAAFIDNDNIFNGIRDQYNKERVAGYDIDKVIEFLEDEGDLRFGKVYFNPGEFEKNKLGILHKFKMNLIEPVYTDTYYHKNGRKSLADPNIIWDISEVFHKQPEIKKFAIVSGDKDFLPIIRKLHAEGKKGVLMYVEGTEAGDLRETADKIGWKMYTIPPFMRTNK